MIPDRAAQLENATAALKDAYYTLRMGNQAYQVLGESFFAAQNACTNAYCKAGLANLAALSGHLLHPHACMQVACGGIHFGIHFVRAPAGS